MNLRICIITALAALCISNAQAQDKIYKRNGEIVEGKVKEVGTKTISYKKTSNPDGPDYTIDKADIDHVTYQNGAGDNFNNDQNTSQKERNNASDEKYGNNIIALSPIQVTDNGLGIGLSYERMLDKKGLVSFYFPMSVAFNEHNTSNFGDNLTWYLMPGIKFYPTGSKGVVKYSVGPSLAFVKGTETAHYYESSGNYTSHTYETSDFFLFGMMVNNTLNINPTPRLQLALELGLGFSYTDSRGYDPAGLAQFGFRIGYRF